MSFTSSRVKYLYYLSYLSCYSGSDDLFVIVSVLPFNYSNSYYYLSLSSLFFFLPSYIFCTLIFFSSSVKIFCNLGLPVLVIINLYPSGTTLFSTFSISVIFFKQKNFRDNRISKFDVKIHELQIKIITSKSKVIKFFIRYLIYIMLVISIILIILWKLLNLINNTDS